jgi:transposase
MHLTDRQWALVAPLLPPPSPALHGRPPIDERRVLDGVLWKIASGEPWYAMPLAYPSWQTCYRRYIRWKRLGLLSRICRILVSDMLQATGVDLSRMLQEEDIRIVPISSGWVIICTHPFTQEWQVAVLRLFLAQLRERLRDQIALSRPSRRVGRIRILVHPQTPGPGQAAPVS